MARGSTFSRVHPMKTFTHEKSVRFAVDLKIRLAFLSAKAFAIL